MSALPVVRWKGTYTLSIQVFDLNTSCSEEEETGGNTDGDPKSETRSFDPYPRSGGTSVIWVPDSSNQISPEDHLWFS
jgi:hypothetical protein